MATAPVSVPRELYHITEPFQSGMLPVSDGHRLYYEVSGNPSGQPAIFLHGGPGAGTSPKARGFFDPAHYKIVLFDQRGSGKSEPFASLESNTTPHLVADIEALRVFLSIERWLVFGGSWGSTLALAYSQAHPSRVTHLVLRGIFMLRKAELDFFYQGPGSGWLFPREWEAYLAPIPEAEQGDMVAAYHKRLTGDDPEVRAAACKAWSTWEGATSKLLQDADVVGQFSSDKFAESLARIECHYFVNKGFFKTEDELLRGVERIRHIPSIIVQGRYDLVCPFKSAYDLSKAWPEAEFKVIPDAGHSGFDVGVQHALLDATDAYRC